MATVRRNDVKHVAVIGGGFGGCAAAYFIHNLLNHRVAITIFERAERLGGRVQSISGNNGEELYETGGGIFTNHNLYMNKFVKDFNLKLMPHASPLCGTMALYNGAFKPAFSTCTSFCIINVLRFYASYGFELLRFQNHVRKHVKTFQRIYELQENERAFTSPIAMLDALSPSFSQMLTVSFKHYLSTTLNLSRRFCHDVVYGLTSTCYCSDLSLHAFAGMTSASGFGAELFSVVGGNEQISNGLCGFALNPTSDDVLHRVSLNTEVTKLARGSQKRFKLTYKTTDSSTVVDKEFDFVILAFPICKGAPAMPLADEPLNKLLPPPKQYAEVDYTLIKGDLSLKQFGLGEETLSSNGTSPLAVLPTQEGYESEKSLFNYLGRALSTATPSAGDFGCWSFYSTRCRVGTSSGIRLLEQYFNPRKARLFSSTSWLAYPVFPVFRQADDVTVGKFLIEEGLIYANAIEVVGSNMEMALIGGRNAALLVAGSGDFEPQQKKREKAVPA